MTLLQVWQNDWLCLISNHTHCIVYSTYVCKFVCVKRILTWEKSLLLDSRAAWCFVVQVGASSRTGRTRALWHAGLIHTYSQSFSRGSFPRARESKPRLKYFNSKRHMYRITRCMWIVAARKRRQCLKLSFLHCNWNRRLFKNTHLVKGTCLCITEQGKCMSEQLS